VKGIEVSMVSNQPWSGYNWYLGNCRSRVEINTDLPIQASRLLNLVAHEGYPGHHTEHAIKEQRLYRELGYGEHAIQLINTPECVLSEGIATLADRSSSRRRGGHLAHERLYRPAGIDVDPNQELQIIRSQQALTSVAGNAAAPARRTGAAR
jgi:hypothetical protein